MTAVEKRLREELAALQVEVNEEKSRIRGSGDQLDQPDPTWLGELLRGWARQRVLWLHSRLGGKEDPAPSDEGSEAKGLRLDAVE